MAATPLETPLLASIALGFLGMLMNSLHNTFLLSFVITLGSALLVFQVFTLQFSILQLSETIREEHYLLHRQFEYLISNNHVDIKNLQEELSDITEKYTALLLQKKDSDHHDADSDHDATVMFEEQEGEK